MYRYLLRDKRIIFFIVIATISALLGTGFSFVMSHLLNLVQGGSNKKLTIFIIFSVIYVTVTVASEYIFSFTKYSILKNVQTTLKNDIFESIMHKTVIETENKGSGFFLNELGTKSDMLSQMYFKNLLNIPYFIVSFASAVIASLYLNWIMLIIMVVFGILTVFITNKGGKRIQSTAKALSDTLPDYTRRTKDFLEGFRTIKVFDAQSRIIEDHGKINAIVENARFSNEKNMMLLNYSGEFIGLMSTVVVTGVAAILALNNHITVGAVLAFAQLMGKITSPIAWFVDMKAQLQAAKPVETELLETLATNEDTPTLLTEIPDNSIKFENVSFAYSSNPEPVLENCTFEISGNKKVLLCGKSGSGKSTVFSLLLKFFEDISGDIYIGKCNISALSPKSVYSKICFFSQVPFVFEDTIRNNICLFDSSISEEKIASAISRAGLNEFIASLPNGIETSIAELGGNISGGEKQRICLARTLLADKDIILLDEFENALDDETRNLIEDGILALDNKLIIAASHNITGEHKRKYDIIYTVEDKHIALQG